MLSSLIANVRPLLVGNVSSLRSDTRTVLHRVLGWACALSFIGHGARGVITTAAWLPLYGLFRLPDWVAWPAMPLIGTLDLTLGIAMLFHPCRALLVWLAGWSLFTALLHPLAGLGLGSVLASASVYGMPIALLFLAANQPRSWFDSITASPVEHDDLQRAGWTLQVAIALSLLGHGITVAFEMPPDLAPAWASPLGLRLIGCTEIILGIAVVSTLARPLLLFIAYAQIPLSLFLTGAGGSDVWMMAQRGSHILAPIALLCVGYLLQQPAPEDTKATIPSRDAAHAGRILLAALAFTASLSTAYAWMRVDLRNHEQSFPSYDKLVEDGSPGTSWLPTNIPASARLIHEVHDLTSKLALSTFHVSDPAEFQKYISHLQDITSGQPPCDPPTILLQPEPHWSNDLLRYRKNLQLVAANDNRSYAYEPDTGQVFSWTCH